MLVFVNWAITAAVLARLSVPSLEAPRWLRRCSVGNKLALEATKYPVGALVTASWNAVLLEYLPTSPSAPLLLAKPFRKNTQLWNLPSGASDAPVFAETKSIPRSAPSKPPLVLAKANRPIEDPAKAFVTSLLVVLLRSVIRTAP